MSLDVLYSKAVLRLAAQARGAGPLPAPDKVVTRINPTCGDRIDLALTVTGGVVSHFVYEAKACLICQASASALGSGIVGKNLSEIRVLHETIQSMLKELGPPPPAPFDAFAALAPVAQEKSRQSCVMLALDAALEAFEKTGR